MSTIATESGHFCPPLTPKAGWFRAGGDIIQTRPPVLDLSAVASAKAEAEARETDKTLKEILEKLDV